MNVGKLGVTFERLVEHAEKIVVKARLDNGGAEIVTDGDGDQVTALLDVELELFAMKLTIVAHARLPNIERRGGVFERNQLVAGLFARDGEAVLLSTAVEAADAVERFEDAEAVARRDASRGQGDEEGAFADGAVADVVVRIGREHRDAPGELTRRACIDIWQAERRAVGREKGAGVRNCARANRSFDRRGVGQGFGDRLGSVVAGAVAAPVCRSKTVNRTKSRR